MPTKLVAVVTALLFFTLTACVTSSSKLNSVYLGMPKSEVVRLLGQPDRTSGQANIEYLTYYLSNDASVHDQPYMIRLIGSKVESFGRFIRLLENYDHPVDGVPPLGIGAIMPYSLNMDVVTQLQHLKALKDQGVLTEEEVRGATQRMFSQRD
ncbi:MAG: hypothetical protein EXS32_00570 [Opitutus sp.]|nr:hypothetical protein [Opitutus sp.]